jgi:hypothetical protein
MQQQKMSFDKWLACPDWIVRKDIESASEIVALAYGYGFDLYNLADRIRSQEDLSEYYATNRGRITRSIYDINQFMIMRCGVGNKTREALSKDEGARAEFREKWVAQNARYKWSWHE